MAISAAYNRILHTLSTKQKSGVNGRTACDMLTAQKYHQRETKDA
jgi:hypothetical protein